METLGKLVKQFEGHLYDELGYSSNTTKGYLRDLQQAITYVETRLGKAAHLDDLSRRTLQDWLNSLIGRQVERRAHAATRQRKKAALVAFFRFLLLEEICTTNPALLLRTPKLPARLPKFLSEQDAIRLVNAPLSQGKATVWQLRDAAVMHLLYGGGLRASEVSLGLEPGEVRGLRLADVLLGVPDPGDVSLRIIGKGDKERVIPLAVESARVLRRYLRRRGEISWSAQTDAVFLSMRTIGLKRQQPISRKGVYLIVRGWGERIGIKVWPHLLRHSCATHLFWAECDLAVIQDQLGHSDPQTTRQYMGLDLRRQRDRGSARHPLSRRLSDGPIASLPASRAA